MVRVAPHVSTCTVTQYNAYHHRLLVGLASCTKFAAWVVDHAQHLGLECAKMHRNHAGHALTLILNLAGSQSEHRHLDASSCSDWPGDCFFFRCRPRRPSAPRPPPGPQGSLACKPGPGTSWSPFCRCCPMWDPCKLLDHMASSGAVMQLCLQTTCYHSVNAASSCVRMVMVAYLLIRSIAPIPLHTYTACTHMCALHNSVTLFTCCDLVSTEARNHIDSPVT